MDRYKPRNRLTYLLITLGIIAVGLCSRMSFIPDWIYPYLGDFLYTLMFYFSFAFIFPKTKPVHIAIMSIGLCFVIEILQLYQAPWIVEIRQTRIGGLIMGHGFLWSDLVSYTLGGLSGFLIEKWGIKHLNNQTI